MIRLESLRKIYRQGDREVVALDGVDLTVPAGGVHGVVGPSGSGKSTLLRCVNLLERPTSGRVVVDGTDLTAASEKEIRAHRRRIGMIFQQFNLLDSATVIQNIEHPLRVAGVGARQRRKRAQELLDLVGLADRARTYPAQLSGGQKQRVGIARALASEPTVLLSDEATSALDPETTTAVLALLRELATELGLTVLLITHEMSVVTELCDSASLLVDGTLVDSGRLDEVVVRPDSPLARGLLPALPAPRVAAGQAVFGLTLAAGAADQPLVAALSREFDLDASIVAATVAEIAGQRVGRLQLSVPADHPGRDKAADYLRRQAISVEVFES